MSNIKRFVNILNRGFDKWTAIAIFQPERRDEAVFRKLAYQRYMMFISIDDLKRNPDNDYVGKRIKEILEEDYALNCDILDIMKKTDIIDDLKIEHEEIKVIMEEYFNE